MQATHGPAKWLYVDRVAMERISHVQRERVDGVEGAIWGERRRMVGVCRDKRNTERETKEAQG